MIWLAKIVLIIISVFSAALGGVAGSETREDKYLIPFILVAVACGLIAVSI